MIRKYRDTDLARIKEITAEAFDGVSIDQSIERRFGLIAGTNWQERKTSHIDLDVEANRDGIFVEEIDGEVVGYITCRLLEKTKAGHIVNFAVTEAYRGRGLGRKLMEEAFEYFRRAEMKYVKIETLVQNEIGLAFYPKMGFEEVARQVYYFMELA